MDTLIINPVAGNGHAEKVGAMIEQALRARGVVFEAHRTEHTGHATTLAQAAAERGSTGVFCVGGDGTALETARGLIHSNTPLGIIPAGTGDDFIKSLRLPRKPLAVLERLLQAVPAPIDTGTINGQPFLNVVGTGFDVSVLDYALKAKKYVRGLLPYLYGLFCTICHYRAPDMDIVADGRTLSRDGYLICAVGNGRFIGGGMPITPLAEVDDGLLDITLMKMVKNWRMPRFVPGLMRGKIIQFKETTRLQCKEIVISLPDTALRMNVDGEIVPMEQANIAIAPASLLILR